MLSSNPLEKKEKKSSKKVKVGKLLHSVIKVNIFCHYFVDNFFRISFLHFFQQIQNQH